MDRSSPETIARLLRLTQDGRPATPRTAESLEVVRERTETIILLIGEIKDRRVYSEEFASLYLPSLVHSFLALESSLSDPSGQISQHIYVSYSNVVVFVVSESNCTWPRFARDLPDEASALYLKFSVTTIEILNRFVLFKDVPNGVATGAKFLLPLLHIYSALIHQLPPTSTLPSLPLQSRQTLLTLRAQLLDREHPELAERMLSCSSMPTGIMCSALLSMSAEETLLNSVSGARRLSVWWTCEHRVAAGTKEEDSTCTKMRGGREMMACSRCLAVRYCSKEHQKADWKRHKRLCFKPTW